MSCLFWKTNDNLCWGQKVKQTITIFRLNFLKSSPPESPISIKFICNQIVVYSLRSHRR
jgi:hypothetical protein